MKARCALWIAYDIPNGKMVKSKLNNVVEYFTYNAFGEVSSYRAKFVLPNMNERLLYGFNISRDGVGRIIKKVERFRESSPDPADPALLIYTTTIKTYEYSYDLSSRLIEVKTDGVVTSTYTYDENSNRISSTVNGVISGTVTYDNQDRLTRYGNLFYFYNTNGDLTQKRKLIGTNPSTGQPIFEISPFFYDISGNTRRAGPVSYGVDAMKKRSSRLINNAVINQYIYNPEGNLVGDLDPQGNLLNSYVYASKSHVPDYLVDQNNNSFKMITDHLGSIRLIVNSQTGEIVQKMLHDEFGKVVIDTNPNFTPFGFAGGIYDVNSKLIRFGARDYDPEIGRWTSKDPIRFDGGDTNLYGYVLNDPINFIDPDGQTPLLIPVATGAVGAIVGGITGAILSDSNSFSGIVSDAASGALAGGAGGFFAGVGAMTGGLLPTLGGLAIDAGVNALGLDNIVNGGNNSCKAK